MTKFFASPKELCAFTGVQVHMKAITISFAAHLTLVTALTLASIFAPGLLPTPRSVILAFQDTARMVRIADIELPPTKATRPADRAPGVSPAPTMTDTPNLVPLIAPAGIAEETGRETGVPSASAGLRAIESDTGGSGLAGVGGIGRSETPPPPEIKTPIRLHSGIDAPRKLVDSTPIYPPLARSSRVSGVVILEATIDEHGDVTATRVLRSIPLLDQAATEAVRSWKYAPARLNGQAVAVLVTITVNFTMQ